MHLCISTFGEQGPSIALSQLRDFYIECRKEEAIKGVEPLSIRDLMTLK
jgi:hypothetical protein